MSLNERKEDSALYPDEADLAEEDNSNSYYFSSKPLLNEIHNPNSSETPMSVPDSTLYPEDEQKIDNPKLQSTGSAEQNSYYFTSNSSESNEKSQQMKMQPTDSEFSNIKRNPGDPEIIFWNGKACYKHQIKDSDNLVHLAIKYKTTVPKIMKSNNMLSDDLDFIQEKYLIIPVASSKINRNDIADPSLHVKEREKALVNLFLEAREKVIESNPDVARYYLSVNSWDFKKAIQELDEDISWEKQNGLNDFLDFFF